MAECYTTEGAGSLAERIAQRQSSNGYVLLTPENVHDLLFATAVFLKSLGCKSFTCGECARTRSMWCETFMRLHTTERAELKTVLQLAKVPSPMGIWE